MGYHMNNFILEEEMILLLFLFIPENHRSFCVLCLHTYPFAIQSAEFTQCDRHSLKSYYQSVIFTFSFLLFLEILEVEAGVYTSTLMYLVFAHNHAKKKKHPALSDEYKGGRGEIGTFPREACLEGN